MKSLAAKILIAGICAGLCWTVQRSWGAEDVIKPKPLERVARWLFDNDSVGALPKGWKVAQSGKGTLGKWQIIEDKEGNQTNKAIALVETKNQGNTLNLLLAEGTQAEDLCLQAKFKVIGGQEDKGAGIVWRVKDPNNYYLARWNLGENLRVYVMKDGKRKSIAEAKIEIDPSLWHELEIRQIGSHILAQLDEAHLIDVEDSTLTGPGMVGLWTKADATTMFDDVRLNVSKPAQAKPTDPASSETPAKNKNPNKKKGKKTPAAP